jgi:hypothetical protein
MGTWCLWRIWGRLITSGPGAPITGLSHAGPEKRRDAPQCWVRSLETREISTPRIRLTWWRPGGLVPNRISFHPRMIAANLPPYGRLPSVGSCQVWSVAICGELTCMGGRSPCMDTRHLSTAAVYRRLLHMESCCPLTLAIYGQWLYMKGCHP